MTGNGSNIHVKSIKKVNFWQCAQKKTLPQCFQVWDALSSSARPSPSSGGWSDLYTPPQKRQPLMWLTRTLLLNRGILRTKKIGDSFCQWCCNKQELTSSHHVADRGQFTEGGVIGQDGLDRDLVSGAADVSLLAEVSKTRHGHQHSLRVRTPQEHVEANFQLRLCLPTNGDPTAHRGRLLEERSSRRFVIMQTLILKRRLKN